eukprot:TRINITY_DN26465_c0_g1_i1.p1 TRINITY_DN26465_c0_g1~~TRINITY_DN26465_c0_g1_i1.p1  ORF type:complete len:382 (-),score=60.04 TRINITY_DN26465_c0_g1_i1:136-1281(-)
MAQAPAPLAESKKRPRGSTANASPKWWHVDDAQVEAVIENLAGSPTIVAVATPQKPPRPRIAGVGFLPGAADEAAPNQRQAGALPKIQRQRSAASASPVNGTPRRNDWLPSVPLAQRSPRPRPSSAITPRIYRNSPRPASARAADHRGHNRDDKDDRITVYVHNVHSADKLVLRLNPDTRIGRPSSVAAADVALGHLDAEVSSTGDPTTTVSLKSCIANALGIDENLQRLMFHGSPMGSEDKTLRSYGIRDGDVIWLRALRGEPIAQRDVVLACAAKKAEAAADREKEANLCRMAYGLCSPARKKKIDARCAQHGAALMPKWINQEKPKLFAPVGIGFDGQGNDTPFEKFSARGIWHSPSDDPGIQRIREGNVFKAARGGA